MLHLKALIGSYWPKPFLLAPQLNWGKVDFCRSKDKRPGLALCLTTQENIEMGKLLQGADRRSWRVAYAALTPSQEAEVAEVGAGQYFVSSHSSFPSSPLSKIPRKASTIPAAYFATSDNQLLWAFPMSRCPKARNSFISPDGGKILFLLFLLFLCQA